VRDWTHLEATMEIPFRIRVSAFPNDVELRLKDLQQDTNDFYVILRML
jgi:hypothetical protein